MIYEKGYNRIKDTWHGTMIYNIHDRFIGRCLDLYGQWAYGELVATMDYAKGIVIDVGANIGTHTLVYSHVAQGVIAFEPVIGIFTMLCANLTLNCIENVFPMNIAIGAEDSITSVPVPDYSVENNFGQCSVGLGDQTAQMRSIDSFSPQGVSLIKIDVEGYELEVLKGAVDTIERCRPVLYVENDRREKSEELCSFIESLGYSLQEHNVPLVEEDNYRGNADNIFPNIYSLNMLCLPKVEGR